MRGIHRTSKGVAVLTVVASLGISALLLSVAAAHNSSDTRLIRAKWANRRYYTIVGVQTEWA